MKKSASKAPKGAKKPVTSNKKSEQATKGRKPQTAKTGRRGKGKYAIYINGVYLETRPTLKMAQMRVETYERMDRYEIEVEKYTNKLPTYEIKKV